MPLGGDWLTWRCGEPTSLLTPEMDWEGAGEPIERSVGGAKHRPVHELRDPAIYEENGRTYLLYTTAGEQGIAIAELTE
jgi:hypothetical protein